MGGPQGPAGSAAGLSLHTTSTLTYASQQKDCCSIFCFGDEYTEVAAYCPAGQAVVSCLPSLSYGGARVTDDGSGCVATFTKDCLVGNLEKNISAICGYIE